MSQSTMKSIIIDQPAPRSKRSKLKVVNTPAGWFCWGVSVGSVFIGLSELIFGGQSIREAGLLGMLWVVLLLAIVFGFYSFIQKYGE